MPSGIEVDTTIENIIEEDEERIIVFKIDKAVQELINDEIDYFKYEYNEPDINNNQKLHVTHIIKKEGERYYEKIQEQREHYISLSWERNYR